MQGETRDERSLRDDPLLRALRHLADEMLTESVPERLLGIVRSAQERDAGSGPRDADDA
jgi:hypothetical protein